MAENTGKPIKGFKETINGLIREQMELIKTLELFVITGVNVETQTYSIKKLNYNKQYDNVAASGIGLGNLQGVIRLYNVNDIVMIAFVEHSDQPIIFGSIYDTITSNRDNLIPIKQGELFMNGQENGAFIYLNESNEVIMKCSKFKVMDFDGNVQTLSGGTIDLETD